MWSLRVSPSLRRKFWLAWSCAGLVQATTTSMRSRVQWSCHVDSIFLHSSPSHGSSILLASSPTVFPEPWQGPYTDALLRLNIRSLTPCALGVLGMHWPLPTAKNKNFEEHSTLPHMIFRVSAGFIVTPTFPSTLVMLSELQGTQQMSLSLDISSPILQAWMSPMVHGKG